MRYSNVDPEAKVLSTILYSYYLYVSERRAAQHGSSREVLVVLNRVTLLFVEFKNSPFLSVPVYLLLWKNKSVFKLYEFMFPF